MREKIKKFLKKHYQRAKTKFDKVNSKVMTPIKLLLAVKGQDIGQIELS